MKTCTIKGCEKKHAAHGLCLMHYKRVKRHGSAEYRWGGKEVGRNCQHCERPVAAREMCMRHYQMWRKHGDALFADSRKVGGMEPGTHLRRGYIAKSVGGHLAFPDIRTTAATTKGDRAHRVAFDAQGRRGSGGGRVLEHRVVAGAKRGEHVHHVDGNKRNNERSNLHVFSNSSDHTKAHKSLELIGFELMKHGVVSFNRSTGRYELDLSAFQSI